MISDRVVGYRTITKEGSFVINVEGSRFIATACPIKNKEEIDRYLRAIRNRFHDADHNSFAYRLRIDGGQFRFSDDGEPSGTAGKPILSVIDKAELTNVLIVVTRYFGGRKLGRGGLARAYAMAAGSVLTEAEVRTICLTRDIGLSFPYQYVPGVMQLLSDVGARILDAEYVEEVKIKISIPVKEIERFERSVIQVTRGNVEFG